MWYPRRSCLYSYRFFSLFLRAKFRSTEMLHTPESSLQLICCQQFCYYAQFNGVVLPTNFCLRHIRHSIKSVVDCTSSTMASRVPHTHTHTWFSFVNLERFISLLPAQQRYFIKTPSNRNVRFDYIEFQITTIIQQRQTEPNDIYVRSDDKLLINHV